MVTVVNEVTSLSISWLLKTLGNAYWEIDRIREHMGLYNRGRVETWSDSKDDMFTARAARKHAIRADFYNIQTQTYTHTSSIVQVTALLPCEGEYLSGGWQTLEDRWRIAGLLWCGLGSSDQLGPAECDAADDLSWGGSIVSNELSQSGLKLDLHLMWSTWQLLKQSLIL